MVKEELEEFSKASGLCANLSKSAIYLAGVDDTIQAEIVEMLGMPIGDFPFKYLRASMSHNKLTISQCSPLIDRISARIHHWSSRLLSHAARVILIKSLFTGNHSYWS